MSCTGCELKKDDVISNGGATITTSTKAPMNPNGSCVESVETGECEEQTPCSPESQIATFSVTSSERHRAIATPANGANPIHLHFSGSLDMDIGERFNAEEGNELTNSCGSTSIVLEIIERDPATDTYPLSNRRAMTTLGCGPCSQGTQDPIE